MVSVFTIGQTVRYTQSDLDLHRPLKMAGSSMVAKELIKIYFNDTLGKFTKHSTTAFNPKADQLDSEAS